VRSEYVDAVNAVRWGWSLWLALLAPAVLIWSHALSRRRSCAASISRFLVAVIAFYELGVIHSNRIQTAKLAYMQTDAEQQDWGTDTWHVYAPVFLVPYGLVYCSLHTSAAFGVAAILNCVRRRRPARPAE
jgi:hypothetical protein